MTRYTTQDFDVERSIDFPGTYFVATSHDLPLPIMYLTPYGLVSEAHFERSSDEDRFPSRTAALAFIDSWCLSPANGGSVPLPAAEDW